MIKSMFRTALKIKQRVDEDLLKARQDIDHETDSKFDRVMCEIDNLGAEICKQQQSNSNSSRPQFKLMR